MSLKSFRKQSVKSKSFSTGVAGGTGVVPVINSIVVTDSSYNPIDDTALNPAGGYAKIMGENFEQTSVVYFNGSTLTTAFISSREIRIQTPAITVGSYNIMIFNLSTGQGAIYLNLNVSSFPTINTASAVLDEEYESNSISAAISATGDGPLVYSLVAGEGDLPSGVTLSSNGVLSGISPSVASDTLYSFVVQVKDAQNQDSSRQFSLRIKVDYITWNSPTNNQTFSAYEYTSFSPVTLNATSAAGKSITYSSNNLPSGLTLTGNTISGTVNTVGTTTSNIEAATADTNKYSQRIVNFQVNQDQVNWSSPNPGAVFSAYEYTAFDPITLSASSAAGFTTSYSSNNLPSGLTLTGNTISGTVNTVGTTTSTLTATAATTNRATDRNVDFQVNQDVVTWSTPTENQVFTSGVDEAITPVTLSASSAAGKTITYSADSLPSGITLSGNTISGTPTSTGTTNTTLTATAATTNRSATRYISWSILIASDSLWNAVSLLLSGGTATNNSTFLDSSTNNFTVTKAGKASQGSLSPFSPSGYSTYFSSTTSDYIQLATGQLGLPTATTPFTAEAWVYVTATTGLSIASNNRTTGDIPFVFGIGGAANSTTGTGLYPWCAHYSGTTWTYAARSTTPILLNTWTHIAWVFDASTITIYVNGQSVVSNPKTTWITTAGTAGFNIGRKWDTSTGAYFSGYISNFRLVIGSAIVPTSPPPQTPLTAVSGTAVLACQTSAFKDNSTNAWPITIGGSARTIPFSSLVPSQAYTPSLHSGAIYLDGSGNYLSVATNAAFNITSGSTDSFICEGWFNFSTITVNTSIIENGGVNPTSFANWSITLNGSSQITLGWANSGAPGSSIGTLPTSIVPVAGQWYHIAFVKTNADWALFVNGARATNFSGLNTASKTSATPLYIGYGLATSAGGAAFKGYISNLRIYKGATAGAPYLATSTTIVPPAQPLTAISNTSLLLSAANAGIVDMKASNVFEQNGNASSSSLIPYSDGSRSVYFDGSGSYLSIVNDSLAITFGTGDFTFETWVRFEANNGTYNPFIRVNGGSQFDIGFDFSSNQLKYNNSAAVFAQSWTPQINQWYHIAVRRAASKSTLWINGVQQGAEVNDTFNYNYASNIVYRIGGSDYNASHVLRGYLKDTRITKGTARTITVPTSSYSAK